VREECFLNRAQNPGGNIRNFYQIKIRMTKKKKSLKMERQQIEKTA
jgi:hypothetical protein